MKKLKNITKKPNKDNDKRKRKRPAPSLSSSAASTSPRSTEARFAPAVWNCVLPPTPHGSVH